MGELITYSTQDARLVIEEFGVSSQCFTIRLLHGLGQEPIVWDTRTTVVGQYKTALLNYVYIFVVVTLRLIGLNASRLVEARIVAMER